ncbi:unnamed protein product, partial [Closterium sp. NIES-54]
MAVGAVYNYLIGTVPAVASKLNSLDVRGNFLTDVPTGSYSWCGGGANCLVSPAKCTSGGSTQRPAADCAICGTTSGVAPFCWGAEGVCSVDASARVTAGTVNAPAQPAIPMACVGSPVADLKESTGRQRAGGRGWGTGSKGQGSVVVRKAPALPHEGAGPHGAVLLTAVPTPQVPSSPSIFSRAPWAVPPPPVAYIIAPSPACPSPAMLALKSSLGVTLTTWAASVPCQLAGQTTTAAVWGGVLCDSTGSVVSIDLNNAKLKGSLAADVSTLTALTFLNMQQNLLNYRIDSFTTNLRALPVLADIRRPETGLGGDYVNRRRRAAAKCISGGSGQRPAADCAPCGTTNAVGPFCATTGGVCTLDAAARVTAGTVNSPSQTTLPLACVGGTTVAIKESTGRLRVGGRGRGRWQGGDRGQGAGGRGQGAWGRGQGAGGRGQGMGGGGQGAGGGGQGAEGGDGGRSMLALKSSLGVTLTTWVASVPCQLAGQTTTAAVWNGVLCDSTGSVVSISSQNTKLKGSLPSDISTLTSLTLLNLAQNVFNYRLDSFTTNLQSLPVLANLALHYNYLYGEVPSFLVGLPKLTAFGAIYNYLTGTVPALASGLRSLNVRGNFLTDVPAATYTYCGGDTNCLLTPSKCATTGTTQRPAANCAVCGTTNGVGPFCAAGGVCTVDASEAVTAGTVNSASQPVLPLVCPAPPVLVKESA